MADNTNILPKDQNYIRAAGFESSSTAGLVLAGQIDEITGRILVDSTGGVAATITVANEATDTTCFPVFVTAATGDLGPKSNAGLTYNSLTSNLQSTILSSSSLTASEIVITDASKNLVSAAVATYPSLTELAYLKGVTSAIQTQLNGKQASGTYVTAVSIASANGISGSSSGGATPALTITLGAITPTTVNGLTITANGTNTLNITAGKTLAVTQTLTLSGTDGTVMTFPTTSATIARTDAGQTFTGVQIFTSPSITTATLNGANVLAENASIQLDPAGSADGKYSGITMTAVSGYTQAFGDLVYLDSATSRWKAADADAATTADRMLAMVVVTGTDGNACTLLLQGNIRADAKFPTLTIGSPVYVGETAGEIQVAIPTGADNVLKRVGFALTADEIYFCPSTDAQTTVA